MLLPNELIAKVIRFTLPSGFENFMLTCKHVHALGTPLIAAHNERKKLWSTFGLEHSEDAQNADPTLLTALDFIHTVAVQDEIVPAYIKELNFGCGVMIGAGFMSSNYTMKTQLQARNKGKCQWWNNESAVRQMRNLVTRSRYLRASGVDVEAWADKMFNSKQFPSLFSSIYGWLQHLKPFKQDTPQNFHTSLGYLQRTITDSIFCSERPP